MTRVRSDILVIPLVNGLKVALGGAFSERA